MKRNQRARRPNITSAMKRGGKSFMRSMIIRLALLATGLIVASSCGGRNAVKVERIPNPAGQWSEEGNLTLGADGHLYLSWIDRDTSRFMFARWKRSAWSEPETILASQKLFGNWTDLPGMTASSDGTLFAAWQIQGPYNGNMDRLIHGSIIQIATSLNGGQTWSPAVSPHALSRSDHHTFLSLSAVSINEAALIWLDGDEGTDSTAMTLRFARIGKEGRCGREIVIDNRVCDCCS